MLHSHVGVIVNCFVWILHAPFLILYLIWILFSLLRFNKAIPQTWRTYTWSATCAWSLPHRHPLMLFQSTFISLCLQRTFCEFRRRNHLTLFRKWDELFGRGKFQPLLKCDVLLESSRMARWGKLVATVIMLNFRPFNDVTKPILPLLPVLSRFLTLFVTLDYSFHA